MGKIEGSKRINIELGVNINTSAAMGKKGPNALIIILSTGNLPVQV